MMSNSLPLCPWLFCPACPSGLWWSIDSNLANKMQVEVMWFLFGWSISLPVRGCWELSFTLPLWPITPSGFASAIKRELSQPRLYPSEAGLPLVNEGGRDAKAWSMKHNPAGSFSSRACNLLSCWWACIPAWLFPLPSPISLLSLLQVLITRATPDKSPAYSSLFQSSSQRTQPAAICVSLKKIKGVCACTYTSILLLGFCGLVAPHFPHFVL